MPSFVVENFVLESYNQSHSKFGETAGMLLFLQCSVSILFSKIS